MPEIKLTDFYHPLRVAFMDVNSSTWSTDPLGISNPPGKHRQQNKEDQVKSHLFETQNGQ